MGSPVVLLQGSKVTACLSMLLAAIKSVTIGLVLFLTGLRHCCCSEIKSMRLAEAVAAKAELETKVEAAVDKGADRDEALKQATEDQAKASSKGSSVQRKLRYLKEQAAEIMEKKAK